MQSLVDFLREKALSSADRVAYSFQSYRPSGRLELTWGELWRGAQAIAAAAGPVAGETVLLLYPPGLDFVRAFFGALLAGAVPVAVQAPTPAHRQRTLKQLEQAAQACGTDRLWTLERLGFGGLLTDSVTPASWEPVAGETAYVQLTSGTTSEVRPVRVSHTNAVWMVQAILAASEVEGSTQVAVGWLPLFHDLGLVTQVLCPLLAPSGRGHMLAPLDFLQRPQRWLDVLEAECASHTAAPHFAYRLSLGSEPRNLSCLRRAFNGGEPVDFGEVEKFEKRFGVQVFPCYGLAEATLMVSGARHGRLPGSCGPLLDGVEVAVRDGRIFVRSPGVAEGIDWLDTGDLGFMCEGELFVTGRAKEMLVLQGANYSALFFERACGWSGPVAAYSVPGPEGEQVVLEVEVPRARLGDDELCHSLRAAVARETGFAPAVVVLRGEGQLPRTTSGKLRRGECRRRFLEERA